MLCLAISLSPSAYSHPSCCSSFCSCRYNCSCPSLSFYVVALLTARHSVVVDSSFHSLSFYVVALLAARHFVAVDCSGPSLSFYVVTEFAVVKTYHYDFLPLPLNLKLYVTIYTEIYTSREVAIYLHICINAYKCLYA